MEDIKEKLQLQALEIIDQLPEISDEQMEALRTNGELRRICRELLSLKGDLYLHEHYFDVEDRIPMLHLQETKSKTSGKTILKWLLPLSAVAAVVFFFIFFHKSESEMPAGRVFTASADVSTPVEMKVGEENIILSKKDKVQEQRISMDDYRELLSHVSPAEQVALKVPTGQSTDITLSDGSMVCLHPGSRLAFPVEFSGTERVVKLEGEAYFDVVHDSHRPFIVITSQTETTVLGTEFNVNTNDGTSTTVTLVKGRVQVKNKYLSENDKVLLNPGMQTVVREDAFTTQDQIDTKPYSYWAEGYLFYDNAELQDVMRKVGQMYNITVEFKNTDIMHLKMRFFAERKDGLEAVINRLNSMRLFHVTRSGNTLYVD